MGENLTLDLGTEIQPQAVQNVLFLSSRLVLRTSLLFAAVGTPARPSHSECWFSTAVDIGR
jgi:hypothetical protein